MESEQCHQKVYFKIKLFETFDRLKLNYSILKLNFRKTEIKSDKKYSTSKSINIRISCSIYKLNAPKLLFALNHHYVTFLL